MSKGTIRRAINGMRPFQRYTLYIVPLTIVLAIPVCVAFLRDEKSIDGLPRYTIAGTDEKRFWIMIESVWLGLWLCRAAVYALPRVIKYFRSETNPKKIQYDNLVTKLSNPVSVILWMFLSYCAFTICIKTDRAWKHTTESILKALILCSGVVLVKKCIIQALYISRNRRMLKFEDYDLETLLKPQYVENIQDSHPGSGGVNAGDIDNEKGLSDSVDAKAGIRREMKNKETFNDLISRLQKSPPIGWSVRKNQKVVELLKGEGPYPTCPDCKSCLSDRIKYFLISVCAQDVLAAISELDAVLGMAVFMLCLIIFGGPNSFMLVLLLAANNSQSCSSARIYLEPWLHQQPRCCRSLSCLPQRAKKSLGRPYDVGDYVVIDATELVVERISLLYTVFRRGREAQVVQIPNIVLNSLWVDNITRSETFTEQVKIQIAFDTNSAAILELKDTIKGSCNQDSSIDMNVCIAGVVGVEGIDLHCEIKYRTNRLEGPPCNTRRSESWNRLVQALQDSRICRPEGAPALHSKIT
ncbi:hypothetical protein GQ44DRAFT_732322 [Phaeosphaeriaceae sp. PMI808]|nr:hypothetical protein GQ44DRAFT_732322 [Phaeosphaeriaceae sp. PMI808]